MKIDGIYIGGWFQRTTLQLSEILDFLRDGETRLELQQSKLNDFRAQLDIQKVDFGIQGMEYIEFQTSNDIYVKIFEDGLITLNSKITDKETLFDDINTMTSYYEKQLSPAFSYIFSLGAPVPKELASIETVFPYFIICNNADSSDIENLINITDKKKYYEFKNDRFDIIRGDKYYFINNRKNCLNSIEKFIQEQIFIREFKGQLHRYLNLHRIIWEKIDKVKEQKEVKGDKIVQFINKLEGYAKTINLIDGRINQMNAYISTREKITKSDKDLDDFITISGYKYETLKNTHTYIKHLWTMTKNYVSSAQKLFGDIKQDVTSTSLTSLTIVTSMSAGAGVIDLFTGSMPSFSIWGISYFFILAFIGWSVTKIMKYVYKHKKYDVSDMEYDKNIGK